MPNQYFFKIFGQNNGIMAVRLFNMRSDFLNVLFKYTMALIFAMFLKILIIDIVPIEKVNFGSDHYVIKYEDVKNEDADISFKKPKFDNRELDRAIDEYISTNACTDLEYNVFDLSNERVNVFLNCGVPENIIYDFKKNSAINFVDLLKDSEGFFSKVKDLLKLKYPTFVVDDIEWETAVYNIKPNELEAFYKTKEFGDVNYHINYNEIRDMMDYPMNYDDAYQNEVYILDPNKKTIAFSFDDGPSDYDFELIQALEDSHSKATFFVVGNRLANFPKVVERLANSEMEVGNHTYDHKSLSKMSTEKVIEEITKTNDRYRDMTGKELSLLRPSYGAVNKRVLLNVGMPVILWSIDTEDWKSRNAEKVTSVILDNVQDGDIVLMHSLYSSTVEAVRMTLKELYKQGYQITSVGELAKLKGRNLAIGSSYLSLK